MPDAVLSFEEWLRQNLKASIAEATDKIVEEETRNAAVRIRDRLHEALADCVPVMYRINREAGDELNIQVRLNEESLRDLVK